MHGRHDPAENRVSPLIRLNRLPIGHETSGGGFAWSCLAAREDLEFANLRGKAFGGSYAEATEWMLAQLPAARAFVLIFSRGDGNERFLSGLPQEVNLIPMAGGASARSAGAAAGFTYPQAKDIAVFAITEGAWQSITVTSHFPVGDTFHCLGDDPRKFTTIQTGEGAVGALDFFQQAREAHDLAANDWDRLALITDDGIVLHLRDEGGTVVSGANLPSSRQVRLALFDAQHGRKAILARSTPGTLAFGCAGLHGLFGSDRPWEQLVPTTYLFGELAAAGGPSQFSNLTFSLLSPIA